MWFAFSFGPSGFGDGSHEATLSLLRVLIQLIFLMRRELFGVVDVIATQPSAFLRMYDNRDVDSFGGIFARHV